MASLSEHGLSTELSGKSSTLVLTEISFALIPSVVTLEKNIPICIKQCYLHFTVDGRNEFGRFFSTLFTVARQRVRPR